MRANLLYSMIFLSMVAFRPSTSIYDITIQALDGSSITLSTYAGKKIVVMDFDIANYDESQLRMLDTLQRTDSNIRVVVVPAKDFGGGLTIQDVQVIVNSLDLSFLVTAPAHVKKTAGNDQGKLFKWLTHVEENGHFDNAAENPEQIYLVDELGDLYAVIENGTSNELIKELITQ